MRKEREYELEHFHRAQLAASRRELLSRVSSRWASDGINTDRREMGGQAGGQGLNNPKKPSYLYHPTNQPTGYHQGSWIVGCVAAEPVEFVTGSLGGSARLCGTRSSPGHSPPPHPPAADRRVDDPCRAGVRAGGKLLRRPPPHDVDGAGAQPPREEVPGQSPAPLPQQGQVLHRAAAGPPHHERVSRNSRPPDWALPSSGSAGRER
eukprot:231964-Prorocentrum_minimum.AAC.1